MGAAALLFPIEEADGKYDEMVSYLSAEGGYWLNNDIWRIRDSAFNEAGIGIPKAKKRHSGGYVLADFSGYRSERIKTEVKYYLLYRMKEKILTPITASKRYKRAVRRFGELLQNEKGSILDADDETFVCRDQETSETEKAVTLKLGRSIKKFFTDYYDERPETEKDIWEVMKIPGTRVSASLKKHTPILSFVSIPEYYKPMITQFMKRLVIKRSCSYCHELLMYIRYFFNRFYSHGYKDGFFEVLTRKDIESYLGWVAEDYAGKNATFRSKAVSFIRTFIDYAQLSEYPGVPKKDVERLIFDDDIPPRERISDTLEKVKYIPEPVREQIDAGVHEIDPPEMQPVYILLRETGWRGTDILDLRYDNCLDYIWNEKEQRYVPYLCGEITKTGIPMLKIPLRDEVGDMVKELAVSAREMSTEENNPERYLFNTYEGRSKGLPYSKLAFTAAVQDLINRKAIRDAEGNIYHFKAHSLRHTRASEYTEQGMPIGVIQQILGHCSLQMTLHYAKVSENRLYETWKNTERLGLLHLAAEPPKTCRNSDESSVHYDHVRQGLDAVKVPFGTCFKPSKLNCRQQMNHCLECGNFCSCEDDLPEYLAEMARVKEKIRLGEELHREDWAVKNRQYLELLEKTVQRITAEKVIHRNGATREDRDV